MKFRLFLVLAILAAHVHFNVAQANACGFPPFPPFGTYPVCVCNAAGQCSYIFVSKR